MSGFVSALSLASEAVTALVSLAFGAAGGVVLGPVSFFGMEVPEFISVPGTQQMTVHKLPGGERVIDVLGDDPGDISWSGLFIDFDPYGRAQLLEQMRSAGQPLPLVWGSYFYTVVIKSFTAKTLYSRVQYDISCVVLRNEATAPQDDGPDLTSSVNDDLASAAATAPADQQATIATAQTNVAAVGTIQPGAPSASTALAGLAPAGSGLAASSVTSGDTLATTAAAAPAGSLVANSDALTAATAAAGEQAQSVTASAYIGRAESNLTVTGSSISGGP